MRKYYPLAVLFLFYSLSNIAAQKLSLGFEVDPYLNISNSNQFNVSGGALVYYDVSPKFQISSGIKLGFQRYKFNETLLFGCDIDLTTGQINENEPSLTINYKSDYLGIPFQLRTKLSEKENHFYTSYNASIWLQLNSKIDQHIIQCGVRSESNIPVEEIYKQWAFSHHIGVGYEFRIRKKWTAYIEPRLGFAYYVEQNSTFDFWHKDPLKTNQVELGIALGLKIK